MMGFLLDAEGVIAGGIESFELGTGQVSQFLPIRKNGSAYGRNSLCTVLVDETATTAVETSSTEHPLSAPELRKETQNPKSSRPHQGILEREKNYRGSSATSVLDTVQLIPFYRGGGL